MVQVIRRSQHQPTGFESFMRALGGVAEGGAALKGAINEKHTRNALAERFGDEFKNIRDPNMQRMMALEALKGERETANQEKQSQALKNIQNLYSNPDIPEEQKIFGVYQELSQNPALAKSILGSLHEQGEARGKGASGTQFSKGYNAILEGDLDTFKNVMEDESTPYDVKKKLASLKNIQDTRSSVSSRESRNRQGMVENAYKRALAQQTALLKETRQGDERAAIKKKIAKLERMQKADVKRLIADPSVYQNLSIWGNDAADFLDEEPEEEMQGLEEEQPRVKFNPKDPQHVARAKQALKEAGGDRAKANAILAKEFER